MQAKVLIVDDDATLLSFVGEFLEREGIRAVAADRGQKALKLFYEERPDLVILDVMMPGMDGWEVCARIRELSDTPVIMLTAKSAEQDKLRGFRLGVDDYVTKPFSLAELGARINAILQRTMTRGREGPPVRRIGSLTVDMRKREAYLNGDLLALTPTEFRLLAALADRPGEAISKEDLIDQVWGDFKDEGGSALRRYIWFLRQKIEPEPNQPQLLVTVRGFGYRLEA